MGNGDADAESVASRLIFLSAASFILKSGSICGDYNIFASSFQEFFSTATKGRRVKKIFLLRQTPKKTRSPPEPRFVPGGPTRLAKESFADDAIYRNDKRSDFLFDVAKIKRDRRCVAQLAASI